MVLKSVEILKFSNFVFLFSKFECKINDNRNHVEYYWLCRWNTNRGVTEDSANLISVQFVFVFCISLSKEILFFFTTCYLFVSCSYAPARCVTLFYIPFVSWFVTGIMYIQSTFVILFYGNRNKYTKIYITLHLFLFF